MIRQTLFGVVAAFGLAIAGLGLGSQSASAEVIKNGRVSVVRTVDNPCEPGTTPIYLAGTVHYVWYTTPDGSVKMNIQGHYSGEDANGVRYVFHTQQHMEHWAWPVMTPFTDTVRTHLISKGSTANALVVMTFDVPAGGPTLPTTTATACVG
ncbi:MAG: hypothetical protein R3B97_10805 [Dehalococcoidia bacterium]|nr:hypothetical protein [Dehalococcoidia bacterium]